MKRISRAADLRIQGTIVRRVLALLLLAAVLGGCASPARHADSIAADLGFSRAVVSGDGFEHVVFSKGELAAAPLVHVYVGGDGSPYSRRLVPASDPTPRNPLTLRLMARDPQPAIYLGRPCYHGLAARPSCDPSLWTVARYSEAVVASMRAALRRAVPASTPLVLIGYSGGGVLAVLLAPRLPEVRGVMTVAANLDIHGWARERGIPRLSRSLDPLERPVLAPAVAQLHLSGGRDRVVPTPITRAGVRPGARLRVIPAYRHDCCWEDAWPERLRELSAGT